MHNDIFLELDKIMHHFHRTLYELDEIRDNGHVLENNGTYMCKDIRACCDFYNVDRLSLDVMKVDVVVFEEYFVGISSEFARSYWENGMVGDFHRVLKEYCWYERVTKKNVLMLVMDIHSLCDEIPLVHC